MSLAPAFADEVEFYDALPSVFFARTSEAGARRITRLPGVRCSRSVPEALRRVVWSINEQVMIAVVHREELRINGVANATSARIREGVPPYPRFARKGPAAEVVFDRQLEFPTRTCLFGALNLSIEPRPPTRFDPDDPVNLATRDAAQELPVVLVTGNASSPEDTTTSSWAQAPWTISVGATTDDSGSKVADYSRFGGDSPDTLGPDVVSCGVDDTGASGTSFAAPVVSSELAVIAATWMMVRSRLLEANVGHDVEGVPLAGRCFVDTGVMPGDPGHGFAVADLKPRSLRLPCLPRDCVNPDAISAAADERWKEMTSPLLDLPRPTVLGRLLIDSARPMSDRDRAGAGFVSRATTEKWLESLSMETLLRASGDGLPQDVPDGLRLPLFETDLVKPLGDAIRQSMLAFASGLDTFTTDEARPVQFVEGKPDVH